MESVSQTVNASKRKFYEKEFSEKGKKLAEGSFSTIFVNDDYKDWVFRRTVVDEKEIPDEIKLTKLMLNRPGEKPNLVDIWKVQNKNIINSISRKYYGDANKFLDENLDNSENMQKFYELLYKEFEYLSKNGWICIDLKAGNVLVDNPDLDKDDWVRLTDFGADWCKSGSSMLKNNMIPHEYHAIFMLILFQLNSHCYTQDTYKFQKEFLLFLENKIIKQNNNDWLVKGFQLIFNLFLYITIMPYDSLEEEYRSIQTILLHYVCTPTHYPMANFTEEIKICPIILLLRQYFSKIKIDTHGEIVKFYKDTVNNTKNKYKKLFTSDAAPASAPHSIIIYEDLFNDPNSKINKIQAISYIKTKLILK